MKTVFAAAGILTATVASVFAGGMERLNPGMDILFEPGNVVEFGAARGWPTVEGRDALGNKIGNVAGDFTTLSFAIKKQFTDQFSAAVILDQPYGADLDYPGNPATTLLGGTMVKVDSTHLTALARYRMDNGFGVHGGVRVSFASGEVGLNGQAYGTFPAGVGGYKVDLDDDTAAGWLAGVSYDIPEYAFRVSLTYAAPIEHEFDTVENVAGIPLGSSTTKVDTPRYVDLSFQTGVAPDTLVFGQIRWVKWSEFTVDPAQFTAMTGQGLVELDDTTTYTLGVGRRFNETWSGAASFSYEHGDNALVSPLSPEDGKFGITLAAIYTRDNMKITSGINYTWLGDSRPETSDTQRASMKDNHALVVGMKVGFTF